MRTHYEIYENYDINMTCYIYLKTSIIKVRIDLVKKKLSGCHADIHTND